MLAALLRSFWLAFIQNHSTFCPRYHISLSVPRGNFRRRISLQGVYCSKGSGPAMNISCCIYFSSYLTYQFRIINPYQKLATSAPINWLLIHVRSKMPPCRCCNKSRSRQSLTVSLTVTACTRRAFRCRCLQISIRCTSQLKIIF